jgi:hypothetical protein
MGADTVAQAGQFLGVKLLTRLKGIVLDLIDGHLALLRRGTIPSTILSTQEGIQAATKPPFFHLLNLRTHREERV